eukprot:CAMPEP_0180523460 /NCGR_PEP_ID=MMETSP1036_2-20121128/58037_1 /TAXON_ID=632150 /ORGANISM="Azadinium spinosum, Strain 3D9" /LENGTH=50 /DNA_ID=CAMNT_0022536475 /DNA_START=27 /DNA_END=175 /DNA_ORIENTATION=-
MMPLDKGMDAKELEDALPDAHDDDPSPPLPATMVLPGANAAPGSAAPSEP